jgi:hypothetical protein
MTLANVWDDGHPNIQGERHPQDAAVAPRPVFSWVGNRDRNSLTVVTSLAISST